MIYLHTKSDAYCQPELNTTPAALALAWIARNPNTSTVILGATSPQQILDNLKALEVIPKLTPEILAKIDQILGNKPKPVVSVLSINLIEVLDLDPVCLASRRKAKIG
jgi:predicted aldo/keto reductase-like oxidoreductase